MYKRFFLIFTAVITLQVIKAQTIVDSLTINPNPFQKRASFTYSFINNDTVSVNVLNSVGNTIYSPITNSVMPSGVYQDSLIMDSFADGVYFVQLKLGHRKTINKRIIKSNTAGIKENKNAIDAIQIYPNPADEQITIKILNNNTFVFTQIVSSTGQILKVNLIKDEANINVEDLPSGTYFLHFKTSESFFQNKILVISR